MCVCVFLQEKTREQKEAELIPKMQEAVNYGLRVLDSAFEQLDIKAGNSDSEDEEAHGQSGGHTGAQGARHTQH